LKGLIVVFDAVRVYRGKKKCPVLPTQNRRTRTSFLRKRSLPSLGKSKGGGTVDGLSGKLYERPGSELGLHKCLEEVGNDTR